MGFSVTVQSSEVEGERRVELRESGVLSGNIFTRSLDQAIAKVKERMRRAKSCGMIIRDADITALLVQLRQRWR